jgi:DNA-directed RNA polymerase specialized sigma24 family protein
MPQETNFANEIQSSAPPVSNGGHGSSGKTYDQPGTDARKNKSSEEMNDIFDRIAAGLYSLASMLVGEGEESVQLVEGALADAEISVCHDPAQARKSSKRALTASALEILKQRDPGSLAAPDSLISTGICIEDDHLEVARAAGVEIERMISGPDRERVRKWLASLPTETRVVFVLCAVAGLTVNETADLLVERGGLQAAGWTAEAVHVIFLRGLCSLASQLIQSAKAI